MKIKILKIIYLTYIYINIIIKFQVIKKVNFLIILKKKYKKNPNYKGVKNLFQKRIKNYYISENKELVKLVDVKDPSSNENTIILLLVVPFKDRENLLKYFHYITGNKNGHVCIT